MKCHALEGAAAGAVGGLTILALGIPVLAPVALIAGLVAGICKDNKTVREDRRRIAQEYEESDSHADNEDAGINYHRHTTISPELASILQGFCERRRQPEYQRRMAVRDFNFTPFRTENEDDDDMPHNNYEERRPRRNIDNTDEPSLRNEEYFRRHNDRQ